MFLFYCSLLQLGKCDASNSSHTLALFTLQAYCIFVGLAGPCLLNTIIAKFASYFKNGDESTENVDHRQTGDFNESNNCLVLTPANSFPLSPPQPVASQFLKTVQKDFAGEETKSSVLPRSTRLKLAAAIQLTKGAKVHHAQMAPPPSSSPQQLAMLAAASTSQAGQLNPSLGSGKLTGSGKLAGSGKLSGSGKQDRRRSSSLLSMVGLAERPEAAEVTIEARVSEYFAYYDAHAKKLDERQVAVGLSPHIVSSIRLDVMSSLVAQCYLFQHLSESFIADVTAELRQEFYPKKSVIVEAKQQPPGIYFIKAGIVTIKHSIPAVAAPDPAGHQRRRSFSGSLTGTTPGSAAHSNVRGENRHKGETFGDATLQRALSSQPEGGAGGVIEEEAAEVLAATDCEVWLLETMRFQSLLQRHGHLIGTPKNPALLVRKAFETQRKLKESKTPGGNEAPSRGRAGAGNRSGINLQTIKDIRARQGSNNSFVVLPGSAVTTALTAAVVFYTMLFFVSIPIRLAFNQGYGLDWFLCFDYLGDLLYLTDMVLQARFLAFWKDGDLVSDPQELWKHYTTGAHVWCHVVAAVPLDLLLLAGPVSSLGPLQTLMLYRLPKLLRMSDLNERIIVLLRNLTAMLGGGFKLVESNMFSLSKLVLMMVMTANLLGCIFFIIANQQHLRGSTNNWADAAGVLPECSLG